MLGDNFNASTRTVGHPVFFRKFIIQGAYRPEIEIINQDKLALVIKAIQQQQQQQQQQGEEMDV